MAGSVGIALRRATVSGLRDHLAGLADFNGTASRARKTAVSYAYPFGGTRPNEALYTGRSRALTPSAAMKAGRRFRNEAGEFDLNVLVQIDGMDAESADARAEALGVQIEEWFADRKNGEHAAWADVSGLIEVAVAGWEADYVPLDTAVGSIRTYRITWTARLT